MSETKATDFPASGEAHPFVRDYRVRMPGLPSSFTQSLNMKKPIALPRSGFIGFDWTSEPAINDLDIPKPESVWQPADPRDMYRYCNGWISYPYGIPRDMAPAVVQADSTKSMVSSTENYLTKSATSSTTSLDSLSKSDKSPSLSNKSSLTSSYFPVESDTPSELSIPIPEERLFKFKISQWNE